VTDLLHDDTANRGAEGVELRLARVPVSGGKLYLDQFMPCQGDIQFVLYRVAQPVLTEAHDRLQRMGKRAEVAELT